MSADVLMVVIGLLVLLGAVWWLAQVISALRTPRDVWEAAGQSQLIYVLVLLVLGFIGALIYVVVARPELRRASAAVSR